MTILMRHIQSYGRLKCKKLQEQFLGGGEGVVVSLHDEILYNFTKVVEQVFNIR